MSSSNSAPGTNWEVDYQGSISSVWINADGSNSPIDCLFTPTFSVVWTPTSTEDPSDLDYFGTAFAEVSIDVESSINGSGTGWVKDPSGTTIDSTIRTSGSWYSCPSYTFLVGLTEQTNETWTGIANAETYAGQATGSVRTHIRMIASQVELYNPVLSWSNLGCAIGQPMNIHRICTNLAKVASDARWYQVTLNNKFMRKRTGDPSEGFLVE